MIRSQVEMMSATDDGNGDDGRIQRIWIQDPSATPWVEITVGKYDVSCRENVATPVSHRVLDVEKKNSF